MPDLTILSPRQRKIYDALCRAADTGAACPGNGALCSIAGVSSIGRSSQFVTELERLGFIRVARFGAVREVEIVATGKRTARVEGRRARHWSERGIVRKPRQPRLYALPESRAERPDDDHLPEPVDRDPCPRCGTRRDIGCEHLVCRIGTGLSL